MACDDLNLLFKKIKIKQATKKQTNKQKYNVDGVCVQVQNLLSPTPFFPAGYIHVSNALCLFSSFRVSTG